MKREHQQERIDQGHRIARFQSARVHKSPEMVIVYSEVPPFRTNQRQRLLPLRPAQAWKQAKCVDRKESRTTGILETDGMHNIHLSEGLQGLLRLSDREFIALYLLFTDNYNVRSPILSCVCNFFANRITPIVNIDSNLVFF